MSSMPVASHETDESPGTEKDHGKLTITKRGVHKELLPGQFMVG